MSKSHVYVFLQARDWEFFAVEAENSDEALATCLRLKNWSLADLVYLGRVEGPPPTLRMNEGWYPGPETTPPPETRELATIYA